MFDPISNTTVHMLASMPHPRPPFNWHLRTRNLALGPRPLLAGIVNVTPDSFSDGGRYTTPHTALDHALQLLDDGADFLDLGGESTRPGAPSRTPGAISADEEQRRVLPALQAILRARPGTVVSIDTYRADTARRALDVGAEIINDVSGLLWDPAMAATLASARCGAILMHTRGLPSQWSTQSPLVPDQVLPTVLQGLRERLAAARDAGIPDESIVLDPGFGFGKRGEENDLLLTGFAQLHQLGRPLLAGLSRKGFLTTAAPHANLDDRDRATRLANSRAIAAGAHILRVHEVKRARAALATQDPI